MLFITFEGPEGSGKTTQINMLRDYLKASGFSVVMTREPGGSEIAEKIRGLLLDPENIKLAPSAELLLYLASRAQHVKEKILPALKAKKVVICDRFADSTMAYQGYARGLSKQLIKEFNKFATGGLVPDLTLYLDIEAEKGLKRAHKRSGTKDRLELEKVDFHRKVRKGYLAIAKLEPKRIKVIKVDAPIESIAAKIVFYVDRKIKARGDGR